MNKSTVISLVVMFSFCLLASQVSAQPSVDSVSGTLGHGQAITISGSGFGVKDPAAPLHWDDCEDKTINDHDAVFSEGGYTDAWPYREDCGDWRMMYRNQNSFRGIEPAHTHSIKFLGGGHKDGYPDNTYGRNVLITVAADATYDNWFVMWYERYSEDFPNSPPEGGVLFNQKAGVIQSGTSFYNDLITATWGLLPAHSDVYADFCCANSNFGESTGGPGRMVVEDIRTGWRHLEIKLGNNIGLFEMLADNVWSVKSDKEPPLVSTPPRSFTMGSFLRYYYPSGNTSGVYHCCDDAWRYFDDIYVDTTLSRVMLADNQDYDQATIIEPQIPSVWSDGSITVTTNLGKFPDTGIAYLFVFDADNNHNPNGFPVSLQGGALQECPDGVCNGTETCYSCPSDCGQCCPNTQCEPAYGETCSSCPSDCPTESGEVCCSGVLYTGNCCSDSDCTSPETCTNHACTPPCENDVDGDGYGVGANCLGPDCDDNNPNVHQNITCTYNGLQCGSFSLCVESCPTPPAEVCDNSLDDDCDGLEDCDDDECYGNPACSTTTCDGLALLMHFDNRAEHGETTTHIYDFSGSGNNGTVNGAAIWSSSGRFGGAFVFDEVDDYINISDFGDAFDSLTISFWFKDDTVSGSDYEYMLSWGTVTEADSVTIYMGEPDSNIPDTLRTNINDNDERTNYVDVDGADAYFDGNWHLYTLVKNTSGVYIYIDSEFKVRDSDCSGSINPPMDMSIGGRGYDQDPDRFYGGMLDELAIWSRALSAQEIQDLYSSGAPITCGTYHRADTNQDDCVELSELLAFIDRWKISRQDVPMPEMMGAVGLWKSGSGCG